MKRLLVLFVLGGLLASCTESKKIPITDVSSEDLESAIILDVRTPEEYAEGHLEGAINMDWYEQDFTQMLESIPKDEKVYVYCKIGGRSAMAAKLMDSLGYKNVVDLAGGYDAWKEAKD